MYIYNNYIHVHVHNMYMQILNGCLHLFASIVGVASIIAYTFGGEPGNEAFELVVCVSLYVYIDVCEVCHVYISVRLFICSSYSETCENLLKR